MTRDEILNMPARVSCERLWEIDELVATLVLGWHHEMYTRSDGASCDCWLTADNVPVDFEPHMWFAPSVNIQDAWRVFRNKRVVDWVWEMAPTDGGGLRIIGSAEDSYSGGTVIDGRAALVICRAALLAVMEKS